MSSTTTRSLGDRGLLSKRPRLWLALAFLPWLVTGQSRAQLDAGTLIGSVADTDGNFLSEVELTLSDDARSFIVKSDHHGEFSFRDLEPGNYALEAVREGYLTASYEPVHIRLGRPTTVQVQMSATLGEALTITSEPPRLGFITEAGRARFGSRQLGEIPAASDVWAAVDRTPALSSNAASRLAPGRAAIAGAGFGRGGETAAIDGVPIGGLNSSPLLGGAGQSEAIEIAAGGSGTSHTAGLVLDLTTRSGAGELRAAARAVYADGDWQAAPSRLESPTGGGPGLVSSQLLGVSDVGGDVGGRLLTDVLWGWGSYGEQRVRRQAVGGLLEDSHLSQLATKLNAQIGASSSAVGSFLRASQHSLGQGAGPDRAFESTLEQTEPAELLRLEANHLFSPAHQLTGHFSQLSSSAFLRPLGGSDGDIVLGTDGVWRGTWGDFDFTHDAELWRLEGLGLRKTAGIEQEIHYGISRREVASTAVESWGRLNLLNVAGENLGAPLSLVRAVRPANLRVAQQTSALWLRDSLSFGRLTLDLGFRYDHQRGSNLATSVAAHPVFPEALPALDLGETDAGFTWKSMSPRVGLTWALDRDGKTILRAGMSRFASQLDADLISRASPAARTEVGFLYDDRDSDGLFDAGIDHLIEHQVLDPGHSLVGGSAQRNDPLLSPELTDELRLGVERELGHDLTLALDLVERQVSEILEARPLIVDEQGNVRVAGAWDYEPDGVAAGELPDGEAFSVPFYRLRSGLRFTGGSLLANGDRQQSYRSVALSVNKRLTRSWMLRASLAWNDWSWRLGRTFSSLDDPTNTAPLFGDLATIDPADDDGAPVLYDNRLPGDEKGRFLNSRWAFDVFALYQVGHGRKWGFNVAVSLHGREGYPVPYSLTVLGSDNVLRAVEVTPPEGFRRLESLYAIDLRIEKELALGRGPLRATLGLDVFNLLDDSSVLEVERQLGGPQAGQVRELQSPRILRLGVRLAWK